MVLKEIRKRRLME